ncbi:MAG TPA: hypothetical protein VFM21_04460, partial [Terriglobia bacterium]|nr:hypothetical protein [Terriglobia bacterium]
RLFGRPQAFPSSPQAGAPQGVRTPRPGEMARDPICGMFVSTELSYPLKEKGQVLHFCSRDCMERYQRQILHV